MCARWKKFPCLIFIIFCNTSPFPNHPRHSILSRNFRQHHTALFWYDINVPYDQHPQHRVRTEQSQLQHNTILRVGGWGMLVVFQMIIFNNINFLSLFFLHVLLWKTENTLAAHTHTHLHIYVCDFSQKTYYNNVSIIGREEKEKQKQDWRWSHLIYPSFIIYEYRRYKRCSGMAAVGVVKGW